VRKAVVATGAAMVLVVCLLAAVDHGATNRTPHSSFVSVTGPGRWQAQPSPSPRPAELLGVTCTSLTQCVAVGEGMSLPGHSPRGPLVLSWDGEHWQQQTVPTLATPTGSKYPYGLTDVGCLSPTDCVAVGPYYPPEQPGLGVVWDGKRWHIALPERGRWPVELTGVSCVAGAFCIAVGEFFPPLCKKACRVPNTAVTEQWDGRSWRLQAQPDEPIIDGLFGVSCSSKDSCMAVGGDVSEHWDGKSWQVEAEPVGATGVSCVSSEYCMATGESWNGASWALDKTPAVGPGTAQLVSVSCVTDRYCIPVGAVQGTKPSETSSLAERWDGTSWQVQRGAAEPSSMLNSVSCVSVENCVAVGFVYKDKSIVPLVERLTPT